MMKIAFLNSIEKETYGGMEEWIRLVAEGLAGKGHEVTLIGRPDSEFLRRAGGSDSLSKFELNISGDFNPVTINKLKKYLIKKSIDLLTVNFNKDIRLGGIAARLERKIKVVWSVGLDITRDKFAHKILTPMLVDKVIVPSRSLKSEITRLGYIDNNIVEVIPIGIPDKKCDDKVSAKKQLKQKYGLTDDVIISVTSGRFVEQKGHEFLVEAAEMIVKLHPEIRFLLLGDGPLEQMLRDKINDKNLDDYFIFAGMQDNIELELNGADLMIHPSRKEPFGIAVLEGMRSGLPIVASKVGGIPEVVKENECAFLVKVGDTDELANTVLKLLRDKDQMDEMGKAGRTRYSECFSLNSMIDHVEKYYQELLNSKIVTT